MKAIVTTTSNRVDYVRRFVQAIETSAPPDGWEIWVGQEPIGSGLEQALTYALFDTLDTKGLPVRLSFNAYAFGPEQNLWCLLSRIFEDQKDCEAALVLEDDVLVSPDALNLCDWYLSDDGTPGEGKQAGLVLCNSASSALLPCAISDKETWMGHMGQGYCFTREQWRNFVRPQFWNTVPGQGWDWTLTQRAMEQGYTILRPLLSRTQHIGLIGHNGAAAGVFTKPFPDVVADTTYTGEYYIVD